MQTTATSNNFAVESLYTSSSLNLQRPPITKESKEEGVYEKEKDPLRELEQVHREIGRVADLLQDLSRLEEFNIKESPTSFQIQLQPQFNLIDSEREDFRIFTYNFDPNADQLHYNSQSEMISQYDGEFHLYTRLFSGDENPNYIRLRRTHFLQHHNLNVFEQDDDTLLHPNAQHLISPSRYLGPDDEAFGFDFNGPLIYAHANRNFNIDPRNQCFIF